MRLTNHPSNMALTANSLLIDPQSRILEMKSLQPYSTTDEYIYAMKEDLADWLSTMYPEWRPITAENFIECLENGVLLCQHANSVNNAARKAYSLKLVSPSHISSLENCKYRTDARAQTFNARDNVSQFIKWSRRVVGVREVLMFESDDLILRKNEKNFLLCLLEIARFGSQFGVSVPAIIKLEDEIEREIQRDKQTEIMSFTELRRLQRDEQQQQKIQSNSTSHGKYSKLLKFVRHEHHEPIHYEPSKNSYNTFSFSHSNGANWLRQRISRIPRLTHSDRKKRVSGEDSNDSTTCNEMTTTILSQRDSHISRTLNEDGRRSETPTSLSQLHKTVVKMTDSCCCAQRFPVIRIGEGKYRIGDNGTIIFIRILRYHVMVRVGGGWDTLENYLNKHDPCRRAGGHHHVESRIRQTDIPILAVPTTTAASTGLAKTLPYGKSVTIKTEEYPLNKPTAHDANLTDAHLVITRDAQGRHHIGQITYQSEEDRLNRPAACPQHSHQASPTPIPKAKSARGTGRVTPSFSYSKPSFAGADLDYSPLPISSSIRSYSPTVATSQRTADHQTSTIRESMIDNIDDYISPSHAASEQDFDLGDINDAMRIYPKSANDDDLTNMDEDSLESCSGVIEEHTKSLTPSPVLSSKRLSMSKVKPGGYCTALYLAQKRKETSSNSFTYPRSTTLPNVSDTIRTQDHRHNHPHPQRKTAADIFNRLPVPDMSKLDRDSGFDEQDFRCERLHSGGDEDNSSLSSIRSARSSLTHSASSETQNQIYRENKAYELRLQALDFTRTLNEQSVQDPRWNMPRNFNYSSTKTNEMIHPTVHKYRKNNQSLNYPKPNGIR